MVDRDDANREEGASGEERVREMKRIVREGARGLFPPEFRRHMIAARKEMLLAVRSLVDSHLEALERAEKETSKKAQKVTVE